MNASRGHPYKSPREIEQIIQRVHVGPPHLVQPQQIIQQLNQERSTIGRFNGWLADHVVGMAGTMAFFYFLALLMVSWAFWQSGLEQNRGFDPYPYSFLFFMLGGIMQSLFVPTMLTASNRATERDRIKDEADHRAWSHLYEVNDEQLQVLRRLATWLDQQGVAASVPEAGPGR